MIIVGGINGIGTGVKDGNVRWIGEVFVMNIKMTDSWKKNIIENYEYEGEHYYQYIKKCRQIRERMGLEDTKKMFDMILEVLEERRKQGIVDYGYED